MPAQSTMNGLHAFDGLPTFKLRIENQPEFYVGGDTVHGDVLLGLPPERCVYSLDVKLECHEYVDLPSDRNLTLKNYSAPADVGGNVQALRAGSHRLPFTVRIPQPDRYYAPSLVIRDESFCGIRWHVRAVVEFGIRDSKRRQTQEENVAITVFHEASQYGPLPNPGPLGNEQSDSGIKFSIWKPCMLPQAPTPCCLRIGVELAKPEFVHNVYVALEKSVVMWHDIESKVFSDGNILEKVVVEREIKELELDGVQRGWQLQGPLPPQFHSMCFFLQYNLYVSVEMRGDQRAALCWSDIQVSPPTVSLAIQEERTEEKRIQEGTTKKENEEEEITADNVGDVKLENELPAYCDI